MSSTKPLSRDERLQLKFLRFHEANPIAWRLFRQYAYQLLGRGSENYGARLVWERMRWHLTIETVEPMANPDDPSRDLKLNDHYIPFYARMFNAEVGRPFFRTRVAAADGLNIPGAPTSEQNF